MIRFIFANKDEHPNSNIIHNFYYVPTYLHRLHVSKRLKLPQHSKPNENLTAHFGRGSEDYGQLAYLIKGSKCPTPVHRYSHPSQS
jgi:hypothetical protein